MEKIRQGDEVIVIAGRSKGARGTVLRVLERDRLIVENVNMVKKHTKANPNAGTAGGILDKEAPIHRSNVAMYNAATSKADKIGIRKLEDGRKVRFFKSTGEVVDI